MNENKPFDHDRHCRLLEDAAVELRRYGHSELAGAVEQARAIHFDVQSRIATARREVKRIRDCRDRMEQITRTLEQYTSQPPAPWIGTDLFPEEQELYQALQKAEEAMNFMGDVLNDEDMCDDEAEDFTTPIFELVREVLAKYAHGKEKTS